MEDKMSLGEIIFILAISFIIVLFVITAVALIVRGISTFIKVSNAPVENAIVLDKYEVDGKLRAEVICEITVDGKALTCSKFFTLTIAEYQSVSVGDIVEIDDTGNLILNE